MDTEQKKKLSDWAHRVEKKFDNVSNEGMERRTFLKTLLGASAVAATATAAAPVVSGVSDFSWEKFFQKHYKEMTEEERQKVLARIERESKERFGKDFTLKAHKPLEGVKYAYALNLTKCNGNRLCVTACMKENNQSRDPSIQYIKVIEMEMGSMNLEKGDMYFEAESVPRKGKFYLPVQCHQCDNPPCTKVCPVEATWKEKDGIVAIDYDWCIGCRYCMAACPYEARHFNFSEPKISSDEVNTYQSYLGNRVRPKGVVEKCHFCMQRSREGKYPACLEACPTGARKFGNILDPNSDVSIILRTKNIFILKEELNTIPSFFYYFD